MQIEAAAALCGSAWRIGLSEAEANFGELRRLCERCDDRRSLAVGMSGYMMALALHNHPRAASELASELLRLLAYIGDEDLAVTVSFGILAAKWETAEVHELFVFADRVVRHAFGKGTAVEPVFVGSPSTLALSIRGVAGMSVGRPGWKDDLDAGLAAGRRLDPLIFVVTTLHKYAQIGLGALCADDDALRDTAAAVVVAEQSGDDFTVVHAYLARGIALVARDDEAERAAGYQHLSHARRAAQQGFGNSSIVLIADIHLAGRHRALGNFDDAVALARGAVDALFDLGAVVWRGPATIALVEALLGRAAPGDIAAACAAVERLAADPVDAGFLLHEVAVLRLRALVARATGDEDGFRHWAGQYLSLATSAAFAGHVAAASAMV
jgi:hypothetical protein